MTERDEAMNGLAGSRFLKPGSGQYIEYRAEGCRKGFRACAGREVPDQIVPLHISNVVSMARLVLPRLRE